MIIRSHNGGYLLIRQTDHALLSGRFAAHWGNERFARPEPFESCHLAAALHDFGWGAWEKQPKLDPATRQPLDFLHVSAPDHIALYRAGIAEAVRRDAYAGLLVSMHGAGLYRGRYGPDPQSRIARSPDALRPAMLAYVAEQDALQAQLRRSLAPVGSMDEFGRRAETNHRLMQKWDRLSLCLCTSDLRWAPEGHLAPCPTGYGGEEITLTLRPAWPSSVAVSPYPFDVTPLVVCVEARTIPASACADEETYRRAYRHADRTTLTFEVHSA
ncbi:MAG: DUF3891 family protein [Armatimonadetes bacterium]|nr:DUF3891 family protein [Armatimonadota bacterium]